MIKKVHLMFKVSEPWLRYFNLEQVLLTFWDTPWDSLCHYLPQYCIRHLPPGSLQRRVVPPVLLVPYYLECGPKETKHTETSIKHLHSSPCDPAASS